MSDNQQMIEIILEMYSRTLKQLTETVTPVPDEQFAKQFIGLVNHPAWTLSHLCGSSGLVLSLLEEPNGVTAEERGKFGPGSIPSPDRSQYESKAVLLKRLADRHAGVDSAVRQKLSEYFNVPPPEPLQVFAPTIGRIVTYLVATHESYHLAQLLQWKKAAGF